MSEADKIIKNLKNSGKKVEEFYMSNKTSDKNVGSIEEDIRILENLKSYLNLLVYEGKDKIIYNDLLWDEKTVDCINAIEHLINNYTRQKQINEEHKRINGELRERVKELERNSNCESVYAIKFATMQQQINEKDKRIQELEEENAMLKKTNNIAKNVNIEDITEVMNKSYEEFMSNYINKQVLIELIENETIDISGFECIALEDLQELLEGESK